MLGAPPMRAQDQREGRPHVLDVAITDGYQVGRFENGTLHAKQVGRAGCTACRTSMVP